MSKQNAKQSLFVEPKDIYHLTARAIFLGEYPITKEEVKSLQEEIKFLEKTRIWSIMTNTVADKAKEKMFENALSFEDMTYGKAMLKNIQLMKQIMTELKSIPLSVGEKQKI